MPVLPVCTQGGEAAMTSATNHPAYQALLRHAMSCQRCAHGAKCGTGKALRITLMNSRTGAPDGLQDGAGTESPHEE
jgi:hypothetical protein